MAFLLCWCYSTRCKLSFSRACETWPFRGNNVAYRPPPLPNLICPISTYIILDLSYSRQDVLKDAMGYDNSAFIDALRERGFYIPECAYTPNYDSTVDSIASALNYSYVDNPTSEDEKPAPVSLKDNKIRQTWQPTGIYSLPIRVFPPKTTSTIQISIWIISKMPASKTRWCRRNSPACTSRPPLRVMFEYYYMDPVRYSNLPQWLYFRKRR